MKPCCNRQAARVTMDNKIINAFCRVDWARLRQSNRDKVTAIGAKYNCKPLVPGMLYTPTDIYIIQCTDEYKQWIAELYKEIANLEPHLHALFDYYKETDSDKADTALWANNRCQNYHKANPPQVATLPDWAQSTEGAQILNKLAEAGYCSHVGQLYQWTGNPTLWAFFADVASDILKLKKSNKRVPWQLIASAFDNLTKENLKSAKSFRSSYAQGYAQMPVGWEQIEAIVTNYLPH